MDTEKPRATKEERLQLRIAPAKKKSYEDRARAEGRSLNNWVEWHLDQVLAKPVGGP